MEVRLHLLVVEVYLFLVPVESDHIVLCYESSHFLRFYVVRSSWIEAVRSLALVDILKTEVDRTGAKWIVFDHLLLNQLLLNFHLFLFECGF